MYMTASSIFNGGKNLHPDVIKMLRMRIDFKKEKKKGSRISSTEVTMAIAKFWDIRRRQGFVASARIIMKNERSNQNKKEKPRSEVAGGHSGMETGQVDQSPTEWQPE